MITIKILMPDLLEDYLDFFDYRAFSDGSPFYPCYCSAFNMSRERIQDEFFRQAEINGGGSDGWKKALRDSAIRMVMDGEIQGYLAYDGKMAVGWMEIGGDWFYFKNSGAMAENEWILDGSAWYYIGEGGAMYAGGTYTINGADYTFADNGVWIG